MTPKDDALPASGPVDRRFARLDELRQAERQAASARVATVIGHLIGTPLNVIAGRAALIRTSQTPELMHENARRIEEQVERLAERIRGLIDYLVVADLPPEPHTVESLLSEALALYCPVAQAKGVSIRSAHDGAGQWTIDARPALLVLTCLLSLASRTTSPGGIIDVSTTERDGVVTFALRLPSLDTPPSRIDRLDPPEKPTGYDSDAMQVLSTCQGIARRGGGDLNVGPGENGVGVVVRFECPSLQR